MPASLQSACITTNHDGGNFPDTTELLTAVAPTPRDSDILDRPMASAIE